MGTAAVLHQSPIITRAMMRVWVLLLAITAVAASNPQSEQGTGKLIVPDDMTEKTPEGGPEMVAAGDDKNNTVCLCKKTKNMPPEAQDKVLAAGWKKRAKKCGESAPPSEPEPEVTDPNKCVKLTKPRCENKDVKKEKDQCASPVKSKKSKEESSAAQAAKAEEREKKEKLLESTVKAKCLSKYCSDEDNLNRPKGTAKPPTSMQCYDKCNKSHCAKLFDQGWEHWYECIQTCVNNCYKFVQ